MEKQATKGGKVALVTSRNWLLRFHFVWIDKEGKTSSFVRTSKEYIGFWPSLVRLFTLDFSFYGEAKDYNAP